MSETPPPLPPHRPMAPILQAIKGCSILNDTASDGRDFTVGGTLSTVSLMLTRTAAQVHGGIPGFTRQPCSSSRAFPTCTPAPSNSELELSAT